MGLFKKYKQQSALNRAQEERLFAFVLEELENSQIKPGLYAQALVEAEGNDQKARAAYIKLRVQALKDEFTIQQIVDEAYRSATKNKTIDSADVRDFNKVRKQAELFEDFFYGLEFPEDHQFWLQVQCDEPKCKLSLIVTYKTDRRTVSHSKFYGNLLIEFEVDLWLSIITLDPKNKFNLRKKMKYKTNEGVQSYITNNVESAIEEFIEFQKSQR